MARFGLALAKVRGRSMEPTLRAGDRLLVLRGVPPLKGRLTIVQLPPDGDGQQRPPAIKRVVGRDPADRTKYWVEADNQRAGGVVDSWTLGHGLDRDRVDGVALFRLPTRPPSPPRAVSRLGRRLFGR